MSTCYPIELDLAGKPVVVIGGGAVAARRVEALVQCGARVRVVSPSFAPELERRDDIERRARPYSEDALSPAVLVLACTDDGELNARVSADARRAGLWCNVADDARLSDFLVPAVLRRGPITVAVGTGGASPMLAARLRDWLASFLPSEWALLAEELERARPIVRRRVADAGIRRQVFETLCADDSLRLLAQGDRQAWRQWFEGVLEHRLSGRLGPAGD